jgi:hypothetical protein
MEFPMRQKLLWIVFTVAVSALAACSKPAPASPAAPTAVAPQAAPTFTLTGTVIDVLGNPVADGTVVVTAGAGVGTQATIKSGAFKLTGLPAGFFNLLVSSALYAPHTLTVSIKGNDNVTVVMTGNLNFPLGGLVTRADTGAPMAGLVVFMDGLFTATTDAGGHYQMTGELDGGPLASLGNYAFTTANGFDYDVQYVRSSSQNLHLYPTRHFDVGTPQEVTVAPGDSICSNNTQEIGWGDVGYVCRVIHTTASSDGVLTVEVVSAAGDHFPLVVQTQGHNCCDLKLKNPESYPVVAGADVTIFVELPESAPSSQTFTIKTTLAGTR